MLITESYHDVKTSYGTTLRLYTYHPKIPNYPKAKFPGVLVYSEIYQVTGPVARFAKKIASEGYIVIAPSIYHNFEGPEPLAYDVEGTDKGNKYKAEKPLESYDEDNKLSIDYLESLDTYSGKVGATGMCLGGHLAFRGALDKRISAVVGFFPTDIHIHALGKGQNDDSLKRSTEFKRKDLELVLIFGTLDNHVPPEGRDLIRSTLRSNGANFTFMELNDAQHAFVRDESSKGRYDSAITSACFGFLFELFNRRLRTDLGDNDGKDVEVENVC
ncbi:putative carboxymethylenebutenolidase [Wickerhamomyces ciferrii]|uniref:Carboxymethylenebutenolidase n=1 Tax=Wickerhamomyces ciferrii (strain ATCC 14091 / BCRC 22168 / CBS 111 / JCM 3599 / NBRC 0793 / NRRL Y-1031 F-60-10) TaxID=1206466 RepID=K0KHK2_WICCF|nr:putative carboxymethylenebutenolidase [Wickerhamomyces ciferrii]CCH44690.1 putative carboxymethylenebutenolidase [Wickerhamomyces ciferrii]